MFCILTKKAFVDKEKIVLYHYIQMPTKLPVPLKFDWNKGNKYKNWKKHKVDYKESEEVFFNMPVILKDKKHSQKETRFVALGITQRIKKLFIIFTIRKNKVRIISARQMSRKERKFYEKK